jgi:hypothetical protein
MYNTNKVIEKFNSSNGNPKLNIKHINIENEIKLDSNFSEERKYSELLTRDYNKYINQEMRDYSTISNSNNKIINKFFFLKKILMNKTWLIIKREYWTRVKKKSFLITTILLPVLVGGLIALVTFLAAKSEQKQLIIIQDESGFFINQLDTTDESYKTIYIQANANESKKDFLKRKDADILVQIFPFKNNQPDSVIIYKEGGVSLSAKSFISRELDNIYQIKQMQDAGINKIQIPIPIPIYEFLLTHKSSKNSTALSKHAPLSGCLS